MPFYAKLTLVVLLLYVFPARAEIRADGGVSRPQRYVADGEVTELYVDDDGTMMCVSGGSSILRVGKDMKTLWNRPLSGKPSLVFQRQDGVILVATERGRVEAYNSRGERVTDFAMPWNPGKASEKTLSSLLEIGESGEGWIYLCSAGGDFAVFNLNGNLLARWKTPQTPVCPPVLFQGKFVFALEDGSLHAANPSGRAAWNLPAADPALLLTLNRFTQTLALSRKGGGFEVYAAGSVGATGSVGSGEDASGIELIHKLTLPFEIACVLPLVSGGFVLAGTDGRVITLDNEGLPLEDFFLKEGKPSGASTDGIGAVFFTEARGRLSSYSLTGSPLWTTNLTGKPGTPVLSPSARYLAVGGEDWVIQRFEFVRYGRRISPPAPPPQSADPLKVNVSESLYRNGYDFIYFMNRASSADAVKKKESLDICAERFAKGNFGLSLDYIREILRYQAAEPYARQNAKSYPDVQSRALEILGLIGGSENGPFLSAFLGQEQDEFLILAILASMNAHRSDPGEVMRKGILDFVSSRSSMNNRLVAAIVNTLDGLSSYSGRLGEYGKTALMRLANLAPSSMRLRIQNLLKDRP
jgi:hypothetical protein